MLEKAERLQTHSRERRGDPKGGMLSSVTKGEETLSEVVGRTVALSVLQGKANGLS